MRPEQQHGNRRDAGQQVGRGHVQRLQADGADLPVVEAAVHPVEQPRFALLAGKRLHHGRAGHLLLHLPGKLRQAFLHGMGGFADALAEEADAEDPEGQHQHGHQRHARGQHEQPDHDADHRKRVHPQQRAGVADEVLRQGDVRRQPRHDAAGAVLLEERQRQALDMLVQVVAELEDDPLPADIREKRAQENNPAGAAQQQNDPAQHDIHLTGQGRLGREDARAGGPARGTAGLTRPACRVAWPDQVQTCSRRRWERPQPMA